MSRNPYTGIYKIYCVGKIRLAIFKIILNYCCNTQTIIVLLIITLSKLNMQYFYDYFNSPKVYTKKEKNYRKCISNFEQNAFSFLPQSSFSENQLHFSTTFSFYDRYFFLKSAESTSIPCSRFEGKFEELSLLKGVILS